MSAELPQEHVEMVMLAIVTMLDQCPVCTEKQVSWIGADPDRMLTLHALMQMFAQGLNIWSYRPVPEWAALELAILERSERELMVRMGLTLLGNMVGRVLGYWSATGSV
jgi:hypothetical protein